METKHTPLVSIVMPVYNSGPYIKETLQSLLDQSFANFELIICDDASTDDSLAIIESFPDDRIRIIRSIINKGQAYQLNTGIAAATGELVAIMHSDDICMPQRLEKQISFLQQNTEVGIAGCNVKLIGNWQNYYPDSSGEWNYPEDFNISRWNILAHVPVLHSAVMFRRLQWMKLKLTYNQEMVPAEDYDIWSRAIQHINIANVQETLLQYRVHDYQISVREKDREVQALDKIRKQMITLFLNEEADDFKEAFYAFIYAPDFSRLSHQWFYVFYRWADKQRFFPSKEIKERVRHRYALYLASLNRLPLNRIFKPVVFNILGWKIYKSFLIKKFIKRSI